MRLVTALCNAGDPKNIELTQVGIGARPVGNRQLSHVLEVVLATVELG